jgi:hypothetical protein
MPKTDIDEKVFFVHDNACFWHSRVFTFAEKSVTIKDIERIIKKYCDVATIEQDGN